MPLGSLTDRKSVIVGGMFGIEPLRCRDEHAMPPFVRPDDLLVANARSGLSLLIEQLQPRTIWLPSFLCPVVFDVARHSNHVEWYAVGLNLAPGDEAWTEAVEAGDLVVVIDYFGFRGSCEFAACCKRRGAFVLEDACQALLTDGVGEQADFVLFSPRKFVGVSDGGILSARGSVPVNQHCLSSPPQDWLCTAVSAGEGRAAFDRRGGDKGWFELFQHAEADAPVGPFAMSEPSRRRLFDGIDFEEVAVRRRENFAALLEELPEFAVAPRLDDGVVPLGVPVRLRNRDAVREFLFAQRIYPPIHWQLAGTVPRQFAASHQLASEIMTLPCDQRYDANTMHRMANLVREAGVPCTDI